MIKSIVNNFQAVFVFTLLITILGISSYIGLPRESSPEIRRPMIFVTTMYPGVSARDMETLITKVIENEIDGVSGLDKLTSTSVQGLSQVTAEFTGDTEVEIALRRIRERVDAAKTQLPEDAEEPIVKELNFSDQPILIVNISNPNGLEILESHVDTIEDDLKSIHGVLDVDVNGHLEKEVVIALDPEKLNHYEISPDDVRTAIRNENITIPGGTLKTTQKNYDLSVSGEIKDPEMFGFISVSKKDKYVKLKDLGTVTFTYKEPDSINRMDREPSISFSVKKRSGENLIRIVEDAKKYFNESKEGFPAGTEVQYSMDQSEDISAMVKDLENNILSALILVLVVTFFFLGARNAIFVSLGIPFSMLISFFVINALGYTLNMVVLFSLVLALGMLVDNGIVIVENIYRHRTLGKGKIESAITGASEVAWPITTSTLTTIFAFFPIIFMPGIMGEFLKYIPLTVIIVLTSSLFVALTITTVFCSKFLNLDMESIKKMTEGSGQFQKVVSRYEKALLYCIDHGVKISVISLILVFTGMFLNAVAGKEPIFFPSLDPKTAVIDIETPPGTPITDTDAIAKKLEQKIYATGIKLEHVQTTTGVGDRGLNSAKSKLRVGFLPFLERVVPGKEAIDKYKEDFSDVTGAIIKVREQKDGPPTGHAISYEVVGEEYDKMGEYALQVLKILEGKKENFEEFDTDFESAKPEISIEIDRVKAAMNGLNTQLIASTIRTALNGSLVSTYRRGKKEYDIIVKFNDSFREQLQSLQNLEIVKDEKRIAVKDLAEIGFKTSVGSIKRKSRERKIEIYADFKPTVETKEEIKKEVAAAVGLIKLDKGYLIQSGEGEGERNRSQAFLMQAFIVAVFLIFMVLVVQFNSVTQPLIILASVFLSLGGVFWGLFIFRQQFVIIMSGIGTISLAGVVVNNAIVLIDCINQLIKDGMEPLAAVVEGGKTRLRPVLLTAITTVIGLLPMALGISIDFHDFSIQLESESSGWWSSMAWAVIYGLSFATFLTLFVVPALYVFDLRISKYIASKFGSDQEI